MPFQALGDDKRVGEGINVGVGVYVGVYAGVYVSMGAGVNRGRSLLLGEQ